MKKFLSLVLALVMTMSLVTVSAGAKDFTDASKIAYDEAVDVMSAVKVIDGYAEGDFRPSTTLTRGAAAKIICNLILGPTTASALVADAAPYKDVPTNHTFAGYIAYCQKTGIISGYADGTFKPANSLTGYAFMKMLLGALGYKADQEGYTGANWSINVAKRALNIGLADDLVGDFNGVKAVNREEACLYAFNTLKATMVEYDKNSTVIVGNITIKEQSDAKEMANTGKTDGNIDKDGKMQFAEKYFTDLKGVATTDEFSRPATMWKVKSEEIGTYTDTADATYTKKVEIGDIYKDLGLGKSISAKKVSVYVDGVENPDQPARDITKGDDKNKYGDNGVLTEVFYDNDNDSVIITEVNTYVGTITKTVKATDKKDAYVVVAPESEKPTNFKNEFETDDKFEDDDYVLYTYSLKEKEIESVAAATKVEGTVTVAENSVTNNSDKKALTINGTKYKASAKISGENLSDVSVKQDYTIYLDSYGYMIYVEQNDEIGDYALLVDTQDKSNFSSNRALLVFADGTEKVVDTTENYSNGKDKITNATIVTYRVDEDGDYTLKPVDSKKVYETDSNNEVNFGDGSSAYTDGVTDFSMINDKAGITLTRGTTVTSMFIFVQDSSIIEDSSKDTLFLAKESVSNLIHDKDGDYYEYQAVVNGEVKTVKVDESLGKTQNGMFKSYSVDKYGVITKLNAYTTYTDGSTKQYLTGSGVDKVSADYTVILDTKDKNETISVADDAKFFYVDEDGNIESSSYRSVSKDSNDKVYAVVDEYLVEFLVIEEVDDKSSDEDKPELSKDIEVRDVSLGSTTTIEYYREAGKITLSEDDIIAILQDKGCTDISVEDNNGAKWTYTKPNGGTVKNATVTATQVYVVNLKLDADVQALVDAKTISVEIAEGSEYVAANGQVKIVLTHNTSTFGSKFNANSTDGSKVPVTANGTGDATGNKTQTITISDVGAIATDITVTVSK